MGHFSEQYIDDCDRRTSDDDYLDRRDGVSSAPVPPTSQSAYTKTITPAFEVKGKRKKLTGYIGELRDGEQLIYSQEYSSNHDAEVALDALAFELLTDLAEQGLIDELPSFEPTTCVFCHKPHNPQSCPDKRARLFAPDSKVAHPLDFDETALDAYYTKRDQISAMVNAPLDVDFVSVGWSE